MLLRENTLSALHAANVRVGASELLDWIENGPPPTPEPRPSESPRRVRLTTSVSLPAMRPPKLATLRSSPASSKASAPQLVRHNSAKRSPSHKLIRAVEPATRTDQMGRRAREQLNQSVAEHVGLDTNNPWRYSARLSQMSEVVYVARRAMARRREVRNALQKATEQRRVPTPQFAAQRDLPESPSLPAVPTPSHRLGLGSSISYWAPATTSAKHPSYMYHEPGQRVRESLLILEELRSKSKTKALARRRAMELRHVHDVHGASVRCKTDHEMRILNGAARSLQHSWQQREEGRHARKTQEDLIEQQRQTRLTKRSLTGRLLHA